MSRTKIEAAFRLKYRELTPNEEAQIKRIKDSAAALAVEFFPTDTREKSMALMKLEEAVMWAVKGVTA